MLASEFFLCKRVSMENTLFDEFQAALETRHAAERKMFEIVAQMLLKAIQPQPSVEQSPTALEVRYYSVTEACQILGNISSQTLWKMRNDGRIAFRRIGCRPFFHSTHIEEFIARETVRAKK